MATPVSYDQQYCPIARGLELLGDRWTILIVREVAIGPQRFSELQRNLPGIAATVLTERLRSMSESGLVAVEPAGGVGTRKKYVLGPEGKRALPVLVALVQFGMSHLEEPRPTTKFRPVLAVRSAVLAYFDANAAQGVTETYELHVSGEVITVNSRAVVVEGVVDPDLVIAVDARVLTEIRRGRGSFRSLVKSGVITVNGQRGSIDNFARIYGFHRTSDAAPSARSRKR